MPGSGERRGGTVKPFPTTTLGKRSAVAKVDALSKLAELADSGHTEVVAKDFLGQGHRPWRVSSKAHSIFLSNVHPES
jgi:hypothetical protein